MTIQKKEDQGMAKDLKQFLQLIDSERPDSIMRIQAPVNSQNYEITAILTVLKNRGLEKIVLFENPSSVRGEASMPFISNVFVSRGLCARAIGLAYEQSGMELIKTFGRLEQKTGRMETISEAPCQQIVWPEKDIDLWRLPIALHHKDDVGPYFTMTCIMKAYKKDFYDITFTKNWVKEPRKMSVSAHGHHHLARIIADYERQDLVTPMIVVLGHHPAFFLSACCLMPYANNDYQTAGAFLAEPLRLTPSKSWGDEFLVPADAEIVIEAEVLPGVREPQNPFGEIAGYYQPRLQLPVARVKAVTMKKDAIMQGIFPGQAEHWHLGGIPKEGSAFKAIRRKFPDVKAFHLLPSGCGRFCCAIAMSKNLESDPRRAAMLAFTEIEHLKMVIVVDEDINVFDEREVHWAVVTRTHWDKDIEVIRNVQSFRKWMGSAVVIIDATRPAVSDFPQKNEVPDEAIQAIIRKGIVS
ncbi:MAG: UbiD family decarboxylase [Deltaproteobacteria bacterium]|nr:UbiD family decarboxylase [Deltaproteobacteria bacterium]